MDLRCQHKKHAVLIAPCVVEVKCGSSFCGAGPGAVVLHRFDTTTGELISTNRYRNYPRKDTPNGAR